MRKRNQNFGQNCNFFHSRLTLEVSFFPIQLLLSSGEQRPFGDHSPPPPFPVTPTKEGARPSRGALTDSLPPFGGAAAPSPSGGARAKERPPPPTTSRSVEIGNKLNRFVNQVSLIILTLVYRSQQKMLNLSPCNNPSSLLHLDWGLN